MDKYKKFLAESVISEDKVVTYRLLSRTLGVHVNTAKQMLYDFHKSQNDRRPGAIHATYLVYGSKDGISRSSYGSDGDIEMASSPPDVDYLHNDTFHSFELTLIPEERLKYELGFYDEVASIHVYSIEPGPMKDMALLVDAAEEVLKMDEGEDFVKPNVIVNPKLRRKERTRPASKPVSGAPKPVKQEVKPAFSATKPAVVASKAKEAPKPIQEKASTSAASKKPPALKRGASSNSGIMQAFSKASTKVKKDASAGNSRAATPSGDDSGMHPMSDDGEDDAAVPHPKPREATGRKSKKEREEELRRMMEEDDEEEEQEKAPTPEEEPVEEAVPEPEEEEPEEVVTISNGRRRGKRRIMRKKQVMDEDGYLVTIQEPGWESFSEDEAPPPKPKPATSAPAAKGKKAAPKGQGSIMSFFSKK
ncbi:DNA polymerase subunit Cdc27 [Immersiella caudata]|uniref:DNA polymerase delta subunit 3 n=1 Tax=Immersiella caudata TaxID=314043 RepID=A0AA39X5M9_9PEZI|nr:DNA polymerase subunit Cdc27 [Immersiella caudata]